MRRTLKTTILILAVFMMMAARNAGAAEITVANGTDTRPDDETAWQGRFFKINGNAVNIDSKTR